MSEGAPGHDTVSALAEAGRMTELAIDGLRAAREVEWAARAADLFRGGIDEVLHGLVGDRLLLDDATRRAAAVQAATAAGRPW
ncbi:hypothetical protein ACFQHV_11790 [Promicromonospora thailandica]|uniref:Uncharacterized protein n=1 Tax=Promicromonospora thailandica TaxID=765201 RepID=A0A9X2JV06_9MICO|nr:hypothetical protein [Promicromonospora thailandica]MCP2265065.1 hypothetical protein [Promicromonospora thailandica]BFF19878.1 hypothetical protein GCM10025730_33990 [Promicromonospora thailandica]